MQGYEQTMTEISAREIASWPTGTPWKLRPRMQALGRRLRAAFGI